MKDYSVMMKFYWSIFFLLLFISGFTQKQQIIIETKNTSLVLNVESNKRVTQLYLGKKLLSSEYELLQGGREVYLTAGMENQFEPAIRMIHADGNPSLELQYVSHQTQKKENVTTTDIVLRDPMYPSEVVLHYTSYFNEDVFKTWTEIRHREKKPVLL